MSLHQCGKDPPTLLGLLLLFTIINSAIAKGTGCSLNIVGFFSMILKYSGLWPFLLAEFRKITKC